MMNEDQDFFKTDPWGLIDKPCYPEGRRLYLSDDRFWVSMNDKNQILFFVQEGGVRNIKALENIAGVEVKIIEFNNDTYRLICTLTSYDFDIKEKFTFVAKDIANYCSEFNGPQLFIKVQERIKSWSNFLKPKKNGLSNSEFVGLWGELYVVSELLMKTHTPADVVRFWIGPEDKKQDITLDSISIEIKTSISGDARIIKISSIDQLQKVTDKLFLLHVIANPSSGDKGLSLKEMYDNCLNLISHDLNVETSFLQKISILYGQANEKQLNEEYSIVSLTLFDVRDDFPRITRDSLSQGISDVKYDIFISSLKDYEVMEDIKEVIKNG